MAARLIYGGDEAEVRTLRDSLQSVFEQWRDEHGTPPNDSQGGLLGNSYAGKPLEDCPPYACMGKKYFTDYFDLLMELRAVQYPPLMELEAQADNPPPALPDNIPRLPAIDTKPGMQRILAALILSEAAAGKVESAIKAHRELSRILDENQRRLDKGMRAADKTKYKFAIKGVGFSSGGTPKKGKEYEPKASIRKICAKIQSHKFDDVLDSLRGEDSEIAEQCKDWYESTSDPIGVLFTGVDDKEEVISYLSRGELPDAQKQLTFRSLRNILSRIKKPKP